MFGPVTSVVSVFNDKRLVLRAERRPESPSECGTDYAGADATTKPVKRIAETAYHRNCVADQKDLQQQTQVSDDDAFDKDLPAQGKTQPAAAYQQNNDRTNNSCVHGSLQPALRVDAI